MVEREGRGEGDGGGRGEGRRRCWRERGGEKVSTAPHLTLTHDFSSIRLGEP